MSIAPHLPEPLKRLPLVRTLRDRRHVAHFLSTQGFASSYGVFADFAQARAWLPPSPEFDQRALAREYADVRMHRVFAYDYPVIHWLNHAFADGADTVLDIGGSVGVHFYGYRSRLNYPASLRWTVFEVSAIGEVGREIAAREDAGALHFIDTLEPADLAADIWMTAGAIHYMETSQADQLLSIGHKPKHLLFNKLPVYDGDDFVTVQNIGEHSYSPCYVYNRARFVSSIERHGYRLVDSWDVLERDLYLPGHPERSFDHFSGMYFVGT